MTGEFLFGTFQLGAGGVQEFSVTGALRGTDLTVCWVNHGLAPMPVMTIRGRDDLIPTAAHVVTTWPADYREEVLCAALKVYRSWGDQQSEAVSAGPE